MSSNHLVVDTGEFPMNSPEPMEKFPEIVLDPWKIPEIVHDPCEIAREFL